jgi:hypothetical protein
MLKISLSLIYNIMNKIYRRKLEKIYKKIDLIAKGGKNNIYEYFRYVNEIIDKQDYAIFEQMLLLYYDINTNQYDTVDQVKRNTWDRIRIKTKSKFQDKLENLYKNNNVYQDSYNIYTLDKSMVDINLSDPLSPTYSLSGETASITVENIEGDVYLNIISDDVYNIQIYNTEWNDFPDELSLIENFNIATQSQIKTAIPIDYKSDYLIKTYERKIPGEPNHYTELNYKLEVTKDYKIGEIREIDAYTAGVEYYIKNKEFSKIMKEFSIILEVTKKDGSVVIVADDYPDLSYEDGLLNRYEDAIYVLNNQ